MCVVLSVCWGALVVAEITGAIQYTPRCAAFGMTSSFNANLKPSIRDCSRPCGPTRFGPIRFCMRETTLRSHQIVNSVNSTSRPKITTALPITSHHGSVPNSPN